jgi:hypothetical protein
MTRGRARVPRWRSIAFWILMVLLVVLHVGDRPEVLTWIVTAVAGNPPGGHDLHMFAQGVIMWTVIVAVGLNLRRTVQQVGAAWVYTIMSVLGFGLFLVLADVPSAVVGILAAAIVVGFLAFLAHPAGLRAKFQSVERPSVALLALVGAAAIPLVTYASGQLSIHLGSGPADEHFAFNHWIVMAVYALVSVALGLPAALKVSGWRVPAWTSGLMVALLGIGSLLLSAPSQLTGMWAVLAILWGAAFIAVAEVEARHAPQVVGPEAHIAAEPV